MSAKTPKAPSQLDIINQHLLTYGKITSIEAIKQYGITRISSVIHQLRHDFGMNIKTLRVKSLNPNGQKAGTYGEYILQVNTVQA